ncbi:head maturation protease, ClpP-related [Micromonospora tarensis]|uniref:head maturation protease, ClpP-related n=1 Tax=Micromonospora tarensis TaxID=2806100 RepID=UPI0028155C32|nr:head maturation protease, ClpP-related [Micromonospora tarensis]
MTRLSAQRAAALAAGEKPPAWYQIGPVQALAEDSEGEGDSDATTADVYVFDTIGGWLGLTADDFVRDVAGLDVDQIVVHLNSPGGDAFEGVAIANVLRAHRARIVVRVDGMAASAASVIAMAGDEVVMGIGTQLMVHDAWGVAIGNAAEMTKYVERLASTSNAIASAYAAKAGGTTEQWRAVMQAEAWYTAEEAVTAGLADRVAAADETGTASGEQITPGGSSSFWDLWDTLRDPDRFDLSAFQHAGRANAPAPAMVAGPDSPVASAAGSTNQERGSDVAFSDEQLTTLRKRVNAADDANGAAILAALDTALAERPEPTSAPAIPEGTWPFRRTSSTSFGSRRRTVRKPGRSSSGTPATRRSATRSTRGRSPRADATTGSRRGTRIPRAPRPTWTSCRPTACPSARWATAARTPRRPPTRRPETTTGSRAPPRPGRGTEPWRTSASRSTSPAGGSPATRPPV